MANVKSGGHIWGLGLNRYACFLFHGNRTKIWRIPYLTLKIQGQGHSEGQTRWSHLRFRIQSIGLLFVSWQSDHFWPRYHKLHISPWRFKGQGQGQGQIWWSHLRLRVQSICLHFDSWQSDHSRKIQDQCRAENQRKSNQVIYGLGPSILPKMKKKLKGCSEVITWTKLCVRRRWCRRRRTSRYTEVT